jgi:trans-aconitate 2-methyltransferase
MWNPEQYGRFREERRRPFFDLLALVREAPDMCAVDLGCGTGELTRALHERLRARATLGIDSSETMLAKSAAYATAGLRFEARDLRQLEAVSRYDLVFSNAALHWVSGHEALFGRLTTALRPEGQLAVQMPANHDHPSHVVAAEVARREPFATALGGYVRTAPVLAPEEYAALLHRLGYRQQHVRLQVYAHSLAARDDVVEWVKGSLLTDYEKRLSEDLFRRFLDEYRDALLPRLEDGRPYFYPFKRLLIWGRL